MIEEDEENEVYEDIRSELDARMDTLFDSYKEFTIFDTKDIHQLLQTIQIKILNSVFKKQGCQLNSFLNDVKNLINQQIYKQCKDDTKFSIVKENKNKFMIAVLVFLVENEMIDSSFLRPDFVLNFKSIDDLKSSTSVCISKKHLSKFSLIQEQKEAKQPLVDTNIIIKTLKEIIDRIVNKLMRHTRPKEKTKLINYIEQDIENLGNSKTTDESVKEIIAKKETQLNSAAFNILIELNIFTIK